MFGREFIIARPPGDTLKMVAEVVSPESLYLGLTILGIGGMVYFSWSGVEWVWGIPKRRRQRIRLALEKEERRIKEQERAAAAARELERRDEEALNERAVKRMERLQRLIRSQLNHSHLTTPGQYAENKAEIEILKRDFEAAGLGFPEGQEDPGEDRGWLAHISGLLPHVRRYGIRETVEGKKREGAE